MSCVQVSEFEAWAPLLADSCWWQTKKCEQLSVAGSSVMPRSSDRNMATQHIATLLGRFATVLRRVDCCWLKFNHFQTWANNNQHVATHRNTAAKRTQHVTPKNVTIYCVEMLRSFGRGGSLQQIQLLSPGQTIATFQRNISQHCWVQHDIPMLWRKSEIVKFIYSKLY